MATEGDQLLAKAEKKLGSGGGWFSSSSSKYEDAADLFQQAGNRFKVEQRWREAGGAFEKEAGARMQANEPNDAINAHHNAAKAYKKSDPEAAVTSLHRAIQLLMKAGQFRQAADREKEIAQVFQTDNLDLSRARDSFVRAGELYKQEEANATANQCFQSAAEISGELGDFGRAVELFEQVGDWMLSSPLTKYSVKGAWQRACLCAMAMGDLVTCQRLLDSFSRKDVTFPSTRECRFVASLMDACEQGDLEAYTGAVFEYDKTSRLDNWTTAVLLRIKKGLEQEQEALT